MEDEFVPYDIALAMKELGFNERCHAYYSTHHGIPTFHTYYPSGLDNESKWNDDVTITPLYQQAFRWFREEHNLDGILEPRWEHPDAKKSYAVDIVDPNDNSETRENGDIYFVNFSTYEEAELACLRKLIEIVDIVVKHGFIKENL